MVFPSLIPVDKLPPNAVYEIEIIDNKVRYLATDSGDSSGTPRYTTIYTVPTGRETEVLEFYNIYNQNMGSPTGIVLRNSAGTIYARVSLDVSGVNWGSLNQVNGMPILMIEGDYIELEYTTNDAGGTTTISVLVREKEKPDTTRVVTP